jgi:hypothetical protein
LLFSLLFSIISLCGIAPGSSNHDKRTDCARVDSSDRECLNFETVNPPFENARSTSVELALKKLARNLH